MVFLGDINGAAGKTALEKHLPALRERWSPDVVIANAENARNGSGLTPELYRTFRSWGIDAITLGDHVFRDPKIVPMLEKPEEPIARPANLSGRAPGKRWSRIPASGTRTRDIYVCTVLGRIFFPLPANDPFAAMTGRIILNCLFRPGVPKLENAVFAVATIPAPLSVVPDQAL
jgi:calcineurin-like phosphoesterase